MTNYDEKSNGKGSQDEKQRMREMRRRRLSFQSYRFKKTWKIFYSNPYGKIGFYILLFFVVVTIASPVLTFHKDPAVYIAPAIDTTVPELSVSGFVGNFTGGIQSNITSYASSASVGGSNYVYTINANGKITALSLRTGLINSTGRIYSVTNGSINESNPMGMSVFTLVQSINEITYADSYSNYILTATADGYINLTKITEVNSNGQVIPPQAVGYESTVLPNSRLVLMPISSSIPNNQGSFTFIPFYSASSSPYGPNTNIGRIFAVTQSTTNSSYFLTELMDDGLTVQWQRELPFSTQPTGIQVYGSFFTYSTSQLVIVTSASQIIAFHMNGTEAWKTNVSGMSFTGNMYIPYSFQKRTSSSNFILAAANNTTSSKLYAINATDGSPVSLLNATSPDMSAISSTSEIGVFPTVMTIVKDKAYLMSGPNKLAGTVTLPSIYGIYNRDPIYDPAANTFIISSSKGAVYSLMVTLGPNPFTWGLVPKSASEQISVPNLVYDSATESEVITFRSTNGYLYVYSSDGKDINPIPPTLHSASGGVFLLGTNSAGNDVWSQFIASFPTDWEVGIVVGIIGIAIALAFGVLIGYYRGFISTAADTLVLAYFLIPFLPLEIALVSVIKPSLVNVIWILSVTLWPFITFTILGIIRSVKQRTFIDAAKVSGAKTGQIVRRHMMPNILPVLAYLTAGNVSGAVGSISTLQFLGLVPLTIMTWGAMLNPFEENFYIAATAWWWVLPPTIALTLFVTAFIFVSRGIDEVVNPRLRRR
ncbi:MAG: ABC transporter permease [Candidatus Thermoplasmatota archaeon]|jgi:peptide/nickel transport system permease protein|nr:ABC transporter permease [Candidatus Thermoplasmatota archaeon]